jgi:hypothetical protein
LRFNLRLDAVWRLVFAHEVAHCLMGCLSMTRKTARSRLLAASQRSPSRLVEEGMDTALQYPYYRRRLGKTGLEKSLRDCLPPFRRGTPAKTPAAEKDGFDMYLSLLEKLYEISLRALPPQSYGEFGAREVAEGTFRRVL